MGYCQLLRAGICSRALTVTVMRDKYGALGHDGVMAVDYSEQGSAVG